MGPDLRRYALIEADNGWQFMQAVEALPRPADRAQMFLHAMEEAHQSSRFQVVARAVDPTSLRRGEAHRKALLTDPAELGDFLATVEVADAELKQDFGVYAEASADPRATALFLALRAEQADHAEATRTLMLELVGSSDRATEALKRARRRRLWQQWGRLGADTSDRLASVLISLVFFLAGPIFARRARARVAPRPLRAPHALPEAP